MASCTMPACGRKMLARGLCGRHYQQAKAGRLGYEPSSDEQRFFALVNKTESCWNWIGTTAGGYGQFSVDGKKTPAHRYSYEQARGPLAPGMCACHHCDNKLCVRPDHLFAGTSSDNARDMVRKGRHPKSLASYRAKLTPEQVREIRKTDGTHDELAAKYGVSTCSVQSIKAGRQWEKLP